MRCVCICMCMWGCVSVYVLCWYNTCGDVHMGHEWGCVDTGVCVHVWLPNMVSTYQRRSRPSFEREGSWLRQCESSGGTSKAEMKSERPDGSGSAGPSAVSAFALAWSSCTNLAGMATAAENGAPWKNFEPVTSTKRPWCVCVCARVHVCVGAGVRVCVCADVPARGARQRCRAGGGVDTHRRPRSCA